MKSFGAAACFALLLLAAAAPASAQEERPLPAPAPVADDALTEALETGELTEAEYALERARSIFQLGRVRREFGDVARPAARDATLILRDLAARLDNLSGSERTMAKRLLARPPQGAHPDLPGNGWAPGAPESVACGVHVCLHWVNAASDPDAPPSIAWAQASLQTWEDVWSQEIDVLDYREPLSDLSSPDNGGGSELDVYLEDLGSDFVFGYCTSDDPDVNDPGVVAVSAYCVIDNDFAEFGGSPQAFLEVTSAHEFHHASQAAYDWFEDYWFMEGTAANIEDSVYPDIHDNVNFLRFWSPLSRPGSPLDRAGSGGSEYGSWIFWRFLEEREGPSILEEIWERAAPPNVYSLLATRHELGQRGISFRDAFAEFGTANRLRDYADGALYPAPRATRTYTMGRAKPLVRWRAWRIDHLATRYFSFKPGPSVWAGARLRVQVRIPTSGARATVIVVRADGSTVRRQLEENANGRAVKGVGFGRGAVRRVDLVLSNGSTRVTSCWQDEVEPFFSCFGRPLDDRRVFQLRAELR